MAVADVLLSLVVYHADSEEQPALLSGFGGDVTAETKDVTHAFKLLKSSERK